VKEGKEFHIPGWFWPNTISPLVGNLLVGLLHYDPNMRLTASEALNHPWCRGLSSEDLNASYPFPRGRNSSNSSDCPSSVQLQRIAPQLSPNNSQTHRLIGNHDKDLSPIRAAGSSESCHAVNTSNIRQNSSTRECQLENSDEQRAVNRRLHYPSYQTIVEQQRQKEAEANLEQTLRAVNISAIRNEGDATFPSRGVRNSSNCSTRGGSPNSLNNAQNQLQENLRNP
jgi:serine/threonine protein kinase